MRSLTPCCVLLAAIGLPLAGTAQDTPAVQAKMDSTAGAGSGLRIVWKHKIGSGYSGVTVGDDKAVTLYSDGESDVMAAFDLESGRPLWTHGFAETYKGHDGSHDGPISTPALAGGRAFGLGPRGELFAVDSSTGERLWSMDLAKEVAGPRPPYGFGTSPIVVDGVLIVGFGGEGSAVVGLEPASGAKLWSSGTDMVAYQSPILATVAGRRQVVATGSRMLFGLEPTSGEILWQYAHEGSPGRGQATLNPVAVGRSRLFLAHAEESSKTIEIVSRHGKMAVETVWEARSIRNTYASPVAHGDHLYGYSSRILACADAATGELIWRSRRPGDGFLTLAGDRLVIVTKKGSAHVAEATPEAYREVARLNVFEDLAWTPPVFVRGSVYTRSLGEIVRLELTADGTVSDAPSPAATDQSVADSAFGRFLELARSAADAEKAAVVDRFLAAQKSFPILEGKDRVHFVYRGDAADVALYGDMFDMRTEQPMERLAGTDLFHLSLDLESDARLSYVFVKDFEAIPDPLNKRRTSIFFLDHNREMTAGGDFPMSWFAMPDWRAPAHLEPAPASSRGRIESHAVESSVLSRRIDLEVYVPHGYRAGGDRRYPVAYVLGGAAVREQSRIPVSLDNVIGKTVEPLIVAFVGLELPPFMPLTQLSPFEQALADEVVPFVDEQFRTVPSPDRRATIATWFNGYLALSTALRRSDVFGQVATQSIFLTDATLRFFDTVLEGVDGPLPRAYMAWGKYDVRSHQEPVNFVASNSELAEMLRRKGANVLNGQDHEGTGWLSWSYRNDRVFEALFPLQEPDGE